MKFNRDLAIKGALVVAILIVIGVSAHLYSKRKEEHFVGDKDIDVDALRGFSKGKDGSSGPSGAAGTNGLSAFNIARSANTTAAWANNNSGQEWITSLKGDPGLTGASGDSAFNIARSANTNAVWANNNSGQEWITSLKGEAGKDWNNESVWTDQGVTAAAGGDGKVAVADIVSHIIAKVKTDMSPLLLSVPKGTIIAWSPTIFDSSLTTLRKIKDHLTEKKYPWKVCDGLDGTPDLTLRFLMGSDTGGTSITSGVSAGTSSITLMPNNIPPHTHDTHHTHLQQALHGHGSGGPNFKSSWLNVLAQKGQSNGKREIFPGLILNSRTGEEEVPDVLGGYNSSNPYPKANLNDKVNSNVESGGNRFDITENAYPHSNHVFAHGHENVVRYIGSAVKYNPHSYAGRHESAQRTGDGSGNKTTDGNNLEAGERHYSIPPPEDKRLKGDSFPVPPPLNYSVIYIMKY
jgi:hypothetical protein